MRVGNRLGAGDNASALVQYGQEVRAPGLGSGVRHLRGDHHERGQILILGSQAVAHPRADARPVEGRRSGVDADGCAKVISVDVLHRLDDANVVDHAADVGKKITDRNAALAVAFELPVSSLVDPLFVVGLAVVFGEERLGVERIHVGNGARHEQEDDPFRLRREVRLLGRQRVDRVGPGRGALHYFGEESRQQQAAPSQRTDVLTPRELRAEAFHGSFLR